MCQFKLQTPYKDFNGHDQVHGVLDINKRVQRKAEMYSLHNGSDLQIYSKVNHVSRPITHPYIQAALSSRAPALVPLSLRLSLYHFESGSFKIPSASNRLLASSKAHVCILSITLALSPIQSSPHLLSSISTLLSSSPPQLGFPFRTSRSNPPLPPPPPQKTNTQLA